MQALQRREAHGLTAKSNRDLSLMWDALKQKIVLENPAFARVYYRTLENDPVEVSK